MIGHIWLNPPIATLTWPPDPPWWRKVEPSSLDHDLEVMIDAF